LQILQAGAKLLRPPRATSVSEWANENRILPRGSAEPGTWRGSRTPYLEPIMSAAIDPRYKRVVLVAGSQLGKTELLLNLIGYRMDIDPAPVLFISASQRLAESVSTSRVMPMIRSTPALFDKLDKSRSKHKITEKISRRPEARFRLGGLRYRTVIAPGAYGFDRRARPHGQ
jgi:phage terminase large subunit GpA-like protein